MHTRKTKGRGTSLNPQNRFEEIYIDYEDESIDESLSEEKSLHKTAFFKDNTKSILAKNESEDIPFTYSINPYRGCEHGCVYCYARPTHEFLGFSSGIDFESKIMVKEDSALLLEKEFKKKSWKPQVIMLSGNTDPYQPIERKLQITREVLKIFLKYKNPVSVITKNSLILRDIDILSELNRYNLVAVTISMTTLDEKLSRVLEPRTASPSKRLEAIDQLSKSNIQTCVNIAPIIPGLNDKEIPAILKSASEAGAVYAGKIMLRLPHSVKELFVEWMQINYPEKSSKIINSILSVRNLKLNQPEFGKRFTGEGKIAETVSNLFHMGCKKYNLNQKTMNLSIEHFIKPGNQQISLF